MTQCYQAFLVFFLLLLVFLPFHFLFFSHSSFAFLSFLFFCFFFFFFFFYFFSQIGGTGEMLQKGNPHRIASCLHAKCMSSWKKHPTLRLELQRKFLHPFPLAMKHVLHVFEHCQREVKKKPQHICKKHLGLLEWKKGPFLNGLSLKTKWLLDTALWHTSYLIPRLPKHFWTLFMKSWFFLLKKVGVQSHVWQLREGQINSSFTSLANQTQGLFSVGMWWDVGIVCKNDFTMRLEDHFLSAQKRIVAMPLAKGKKLGVF